MTEQKMVGLFTVYNCKNSHPKGDVIFVHGLAGHPWATWHPQNQTDNKNIDFWPFWLGETLLEKKIDVNIWSFGYEAPGFKYFGQGMSRFDQASNLLESLKVKNIGDSPFIFVTHSLGGLIVKEVIRSAQNFPQYQDILQQIKGIVFLSTPHTGAHLTNLIQNIVFLTQPTVNIEELQEHSPQLRSLNEWYRQNVDKLGIQTKVFYETKPLNGILVVDEDSSNPGIRDVKPVATPEDHISITKPEKNDLVYLSTIKFCEDVFISKIEKNKSQDANFAKIIINNTKNVSRKGEPAEFPNNLNILRTGAVKFVGRDKDIKDLHEQLQEKERVSITAVVTGMAGVGKTELALQYSLLSEKKLNYPGGICWINVRERSVEEQLLGFAKSQLGLFPDEVLKLEQKLSFCWSNWQPPGDVLIVLDDVNKYEEIEQYLPPQKQRFKLLITTRKYWLSESFSQLRLEVLDEDSALELLEVLIGNSRLGTQIEEAKQLCEWLGYLPLGLELVGRFLKRRSEWTLERMIQELEKQALNFSVLQNPQGEMTAQRGVAAAFELSWNELDERGRYLGCLLSIFALAPIPWNLVEKCLSKDESREKGIIQRWLSTFSRLWLLLMPPKKVDVLDSRTWEDIREDTLLDLNLIQKTTQGTYELHQLVRRYFQDKLNAMKEVEQLKSQFCRVIVGAARKIPDNITVEQVKEVEIDIPHITEIADNLAEYLSNDDLITPFTRLGSFYEDQGLYPLAQPWLEKGKEIAEKSLDKNNSDIAITYSYLAGLYRAQGKYEAAEQLYLQAIEIHKIALPENHPGIATDLNNLALLYRAQGKYEAAEQLYLQAIDISKIALPENHPERATHLNNLAGLYYSQGKYEAAEPLYLQAIEIDKIALPENHPERAAQLNNLAELYREQGKYEAAEPLYLQAIEIDKIALPKNHPQLATHLNNLAGLYYSQGKYEAAEQLYLQAIEIDKIALPENHPQLATHLNNLALLYKSQGKYEAAEQLYLQAIEIDKIALPENHPRIAIDLNNLALLYKSQGKYEAAEPLFLQAIEIHKIALPENHPSLAIDLNNLASLYYAQGKYEAAEPLLLQVIEIFTQSLGEEHPNTQTVLENYQIFLNKKNESKQNQDKY